MKILVVCVGNICRSPLAERLLQMRLDALRPGGFTVSSAGVGARAGQPMDAHAAAELVRLGGSPDGFASRVASPQVIEGADLVLTMTKDLRTRVLGRSPRMMRRTFTLGELAAVCDAVPELRTTPDLVATAARSRAHGAEALDVPDPIGQSPRVHADTADLISAYVDAQVAVLGAR
jgi:protein-tyrosine phosphatase